MGVTLYNIEDGPSFDAWSELDKSDLWNLSPGLITGVLTGMSVTEHSGGDMEVVVASGTVVSNGTTYTYSGAGSPFTINTASGADRWDLIVYRPGSQVIYIPGTPCSLIGTNWTRSSTYDPPVKPTINQGIDVVLAAIYVGYDDAFVTTADNIVDRRQFVSSGSLVTPAEIGALAIVNNLGDVANTGSSRLNLHVSSQTAAATVYTANVAFSGGGPSLGVGDVNDGYTLASTDLVLLTAQTTASQNGLWLIPATGVPTRPTEFASGATVFGQTVAIINGAAYENSQWLLDAPTGGVDIDTDPQVWGSLVGGGGGGGHVGGSTLYGYLQTTGTLMSGGTPTYYNGTNGATLASLSGQLDVYSTLGAAPNGSGVVNASDGWHTFTYTGISSTAGAQSFLGCVFSGDNTQTLVSYGGGRTSVIANPLSTRYPAATPQQGASSIFGSYFQNVHPFPPITGAAWTSANGGTLTYTFATPITGTAGQVGDIFTARTDNFQPTGYDVGDGVFPDQTFTVISANTAACTGQGSNPGTCTQFGSMRSLVWYGPETEPTWAGAGPPAIFMFQSAVNTAIPNTPILGPLPVMYNQATATNAIPLAVSGCTLVSGDTVTISGPPPDGLIIGQAVYSVSGTGVLGSPNPAASNYESGSTSNLLLNTHITKISYDGTNTTLTLDTNNNTTGSNTLAFYNDYLNAPANFIQEAWMIGNGAPTWTSPQQMNDIYVDFAVNDGATLAGAGWFGPKVGGSLGSGTQGDLGLGFSEYATAAGNYGGFGPLAHEVFGWFSGTIGGGGNPQMTAQNIPVPSAATVSYGMISPAPDAKPSGQPVASIGPGSLSASIGSFTGTASLHTAALLGAATSINQGPYGLNTEALTLAGGATTLSAIQANGGMTVTLSAGGYAWPLAGSGVIVDTSGNWHLFAYQGLVEAFGVFIFDNIYFSGNITGVNVPNNAAIQPVGFLTDTLGNLAAITWPNNFAQALIDVDTVSGTPSGGWGNTGVGTFGPNLVGGSNTQQCQGTFLVDPSRSELVTLTAGASLTATNNYVLSRQQIAYSTFAAPYGTSPTVASLGGSNGSIPLNSTAGFPGPRVYEGSYASVRPQLCSVVTSGGTYTVSYLWVDDMTATLEGCNWPNSAYKGASGTATGGSSTTCVESGAGWTSAQWVGYTVTITSGSAAGQTATITSNTATTLTFSGGLSGSGSVSSGNTFTIGYVVLNNADVYALYQPIDGQKLTIVNGSFNQGGGTPTLTFVDANDLQLGNSAGRGIGPGGSLSAVFKSDLGMWVETSYSPGSGASSVNGSAWFNVLSYGAVGNGTTDDEPAFALAIAAAEAQGPASVVYAPSGYIYGTKKPIILQAANGIVFQGDKGATQSGNDEALDNGTIIKPISSGWSNPTYGNIANAAVLLLPASVGQETYTPSANGSNTLTLTTTQAGVLNTALGSHTILVIGPGITYNVIISAINTGTGVVTLTVEPKQAGSIGTLASGGSNSYTFWWSITPTTSISLRNFWVDCSNLSMSAGGIDGIAQIGNVQTAEYINVGSYAAPGNAFGIYGGDAQHFDTCGAYVAGSNGVFFDGGDATLINVHAQNNGQNWPGLTSGPLGNGWFPTGGYDGFLFVTGGANTKLTNCRADLNQNCGFTINSLNNYTGGYYNSLILTGCNTQRNNFYGFSAVNTSTGGSQGSTSLMLANCAFEGDGVNSSTWTTGAPTNGIGGGQFAGMLFSGTWLVTLSNVDTNAYSVDMTGTPSPAASCPHNGLAIDSTYNPGGLVTVRYSSGLLNYDTGVPLYNISEALLFYAADSVVGIGGFLPTSMNSVYAATMTDHQNPSTAGWGPNTVVAASAIPLLGSGTATGGTTSTCVESGAGWTTNQWVGYTLTMTSGTLIGLTAIVTSNTATTLTFATGALGGSPASGNTFTIGGPLPIFTTGTLLPGRYNLFGQIQYDTNGGSPTAGDTVAWGLYGGSASLGGSPPGAGGYARLASSTGNLNAHPLPINFDINVTAAGTVQIQMVTKSAGVNVEPYSQPSIVSNQFASWLTCQKYT